MNQHLGPDDSISVVESLGAFQAARGLRTSLHHLGPHRKASTGLKCQCFWTRRFPKEPEQQNVALKSVALMNLDLSSRGFQSSAFNAF